MVGIGHMRQASSGASTAFSVQESSSCGAAACAGASSDAAGACAWISTCAAGGIRVMHVPAALWLIFNILLIRLCIILLSLEQLTTAIQFVCAQQHVWQLMTNSAVHHLETVTPRFQPTEMWIENVAQRRCSTTYRISNLLSTRGLSAPERLHLVCVCSLTSPNNSGAMCCCCRKKA